MKRDMELVRKLLIFFEESDGKHVPVPPIDGYDKWAIKYHLNLLYDAGFLWGEPTRSTTSDRLIEVLPFELTWEGQEFLSRVRTDFIWEEVQASMRSKGVVNASIDMVKRLADKAIRKRLEV